MKKYQLSIGKWQEDTMNELRRRVDDLTYNEEQELVYESNSKMKAEVVKELAIIIINKHEPGKKDLHEMFKVMAQ